HDVSIHRKGDRAARVGFEAKTLKAEQDFLLQWNVSEDALAPLLVTHRGHEKDGFFYLSITPRPEQPTQVPPKDVVFAIDTSGSMTGKKMEQVRKALRYCVANLNANDRFNIVDFSTEARRFQKDVVPANAETKKQANLYIDQLVARGGTNIEEAMRYALEAKDASRLRLVVLLTDGEPTIGVTRPEDVLASLKKINSTQQRVFVFGVGMDLNAKLLDSIVLDHKGAAQYIRGDQDLEVPLSAFYDKVDSPVLTNVSIEVKGARVSSVYPKPIPDLFRGDQLDVFGRYDTDGFKTVIVKGNYLGKPRVFEYSLEFRGDKHDEIPQLWALRAIGHLLEEIRLKGEKNELKDEVIRLSKLYGVLTPYTSYLILEEGALARVPRAPGANAGAVPLYRYALEDALGVRPNARPSASRVAGGAAGAVRDREVRRALRKNKAEFDSARGAKSVEYSERILRLKKGVADAEKDLSGAWKLSEPRQQGQSAGKAIVRMRKLAGRTFYLQGKRWIDSVLTTRELKKDEKITTVKYLSDEYFDLLKKYNGIGKLLSIGPEVSFVWNGSLMSIVK
ncbi:MAG: VWA domain-containing protein, partial [Planctomycetota bacterium]